MYKSCIFSFKYSSENFVQIFLFKKVKLLDSLVDVNRFLPVEQLGQGGISTSQTH